MTSASFERLQIELDRCPYHAFLGPEPVSAEGGTVEVALPFRPAFRLADGSDLYHGGGLAALIDITGHAVVAVATERVSPAIDLRINRLQEARGARLVATGRLVKAGVHVARADIEVRDPDSPMVVNGRGTFCTR